MKIRDLMTQPPLTVRCEDDAGLALQLMAWGDVRHLPVMREGKLAGVVSERDLLARGSGNPPIAEIMNSPALTASPDEEIAIVAQRMVTAKVGCLPVVDRGELVGIVTVTDIVAAQAAVQPEDDEPLTVRSAMTLDPLTVSGDDFLLEAVAWMSERQIRHAPVTDSGGRVVGMLSDRDIRLALSASLAVVHDGLTSTRIQYLKVHDAMSGDPLVVRESTPLRDAAAAFLRKNIGALPVVDAAGRIVGILSYVDVLRTFVGARAGWRSVARHSTGAEAVH